MKLERIEVGREYAMAESHFRQRLCHVKVLAVGVPYDKLYNERYPNARKIWRNGVLIEMLHRYDLRLRWPTNRVTRFNLRGEWLGRRRYIVASHLIVEPWDPSYHPKAIAQAREKREAPMRRYLQAKDDYFAMVRRHVIPEFPNARIIGSELGAAVHIPLYDAARLIEMVRLLEEEVPNFRERLARRATARRQPIIEARADVNDDKLPLYLFRDEIKRYRSEHGIYRTYQGSRKPKVH